MNHSAPEPVKILTIAGSDSGGAAGLQADLKTFAALGVYGMSAVTVVTAQDSRAVHGVHPLPAKFVVAQLEAVLADYGAAAVKTGFIGRVDLIVAIAAVLAQYRPAHLVVDPVLVNHRGEPMFDATVTQAYREHLLPLAELVTPNRHEARLLSGATDRTATLAALAALTSGAVLLKGVRDGAMVVDYLANGRETVTLPAPWLETANTHGSGDVLSAASAAFLAQGETVEAAVRRAHGFTHEAIASAADWRLGAGHGPVNPLWHQPKLSQ